MKKVLISVLLVLLTLCLFVSCKDEPKVNTVYLNDENDELLATFLIPSSYSSWDEFSNDDCCVTSVKGDWKLSFYNSKLRVDYHGDWDETNIECFSDKSRTTIYLSNQIIDGMTIYKLPEPLDD